MVIEKWIDGVFVWSSENGNITIEVPFGWNKKRNLPAWRKKHQKEIDYLKKLTGNKSTLKYWRIAERKKLELEKKSYFLYLPELGYFGLNTWKFLRIY